MTLKPLDPNQLDVDYASELIGLLKEGKVKLGYPREIDEYIALRESDKAAVIKFSGWDSEQPYRIAPMADRISTAFADFLWGDDPSVEANDSADDDLLAEIIKNNDFSDELHYAEEIKSSESQVWWRIYTDPMQMDVPILEWHSRTEVVPLRRGKRLLAVGFIDVIEENSYSGDEQHDKTTYECWRRLEVYGPGVTYNVLFRSDSAGNLGAQVALDSRPETADYLEEWRHGLPMLAGCILNRHGKGRRKRYEGRSDYHGVKDLLYDLNEAHSVDRANFRLAGKKRAVMPEKYRDADGTARDADVYFAESEDEMEGDNTFKLLEYTYDGAASIARKQDLMSTILSLVGLARQLVDPNSGDGGGPASGIALRTRLIPMVATARGKARPWDEELPGIMTLMQQVDALDEGHGGFARPWKAAAEPPSIERGSILPEDPREELDWHVAAVTADLEAIETGIEELHPDWDETRVKEELRRIQDENVKFASGGFGGLPPVDTTALDGGAVDAAGNPIDTGAVGDAGTIDNSASADQTLTPEEFAAQFGNG